MGSLDVRLVVDCRNLLGECVLWNAGEQRVYWTDVYANRLYSADAEGRELAVRELPDRLGSFAFDARGDLLCALSKGLFRYQLSTGRLERLTHFEPELEATRLNDGRCDRNGRFVVGGCHQGFYNPVSSVISYQGGESARTLLREVALTNGIAFSVDGRRMYFSDSETLIYQRYDYDPASGDLGEGHVFARIPRGQGFADGSCVDADDNVFNARYYGGFVQEYRPDGSEGLRIPLPTACPTCVCFGGPELDTLFITTARKDLGPDALAAQPHAGGLFKVKLPRRGLPESRFGLALFSEETVAPA